MRGKIDLDIFSIEVAVFATEDDRIKGLAELGMDDLARHTDAAFASAHRDVSSGGDVRFSMVIKPEATQATWAHECVHMADFVMDHLHLPMGVKNTEIRAYLVGHLFSRLQDIMEPQDA